MADDLHRVPVPEEPASRALDRVSLRGLAGFGRHGVFDFEREQGQHFVIDVTLRVSTAQAAASDDVADTVHYGELAERIVEIVAGEPVNLIETVAERIATEVLADTRIAGTDVTVHKPDAPIAHSFTDVSVTVRRDRS